MNDPYEFDPYVVMSETPITFRGLCQGWLVFFIGGAVVLGALGFAELMIWILK